jgi:hypothetical protein
MKTQSSCMNMEYTRVLWPTKSSWRYGRSCDRDFFFFFFFFLVKARPKAWPAWDTSSMYYKGSLVQHDA